MKNMSSFQSQHYGIGTPYPRSGLSLPRRDEWLAHFLSLNHGTVFGRVWGANTLGCFYLFLHPFSLTLLFLDRKNAHESEQQFHASNIKIGAHPWIPVWFCFHVVDLDIQVHSIVSRFWLVWVRRSPYMWIIVSRRMYLPRKMLAFFFLFLLKCRFLPRVQNRK